MVYTTLTTNGTVAISSLKYDAPAIASCADDCRSISSTVDVNDAAQQKQTCPRRKRVRFDMTSNVEYKNTRIYKEELLGLDTWYAHDESIALKEDARKSAKEIVKSDNALTGSYQFLMERLYQASCKKQVDETDLLDVLCWSPTEMQQLQQLLEMESHRIGLEKYVVLRIGRDRRIRRNELVESVIEIQKQSKDQNEPPEYRLRQYCESISRPSKVMARLLAEARCASTNQS